MGNAVNIKIVKNKVAPPFKVASVDIIYGQGISKEGEIIDLASEFDIVRKSGSWYEYDGVKIAQGREAAKQWLKNNQKEKEDIINKVRERLALK